MLSRNAAATRLGRAVGRRAGLAVTTALVVGSSLLANPAGAEPAARGKTEPAVLGDVLMVQANIYSGLTVPQFQADVRKVLDLGADFITYNEVPLRNDLVMAPPAEGWAIHRSMKNRYTKATAVAWRTDKWTMVESGTRRISNYRGKPPGRKIELGRRFANWVTLNAPDGRVVSVISAHVAPVTKDMPDLRRKSVRHIGELVEELSPRGPVLVGGDFNVHYRSGAYPRDLLDAARMMPTYDMLGNFFPTGDHRGATIDYVFARGAQQTWAADHRPMELKSDHDAVLAGFTWLVDAPAETQVLTSDPDGDKVAKRAVAKTVAQTVKDAQTGSIVEVMTDGFDQRALYRKMRAALVRGVHVRFTTRSAELTPRERRLSRLVEASQDDQSWFRRCLDECGDAWKAAGVPRGLVMVSNPSQQWRVRLDTNTDLTNLSARAVRLEIRTGRYGLADGEQLLQAAPTA